jgi:Kdo2-lipid IVA lauroyltransferase/acyltransferase
MIKKMQYYTLAIPIYMLVSLPFPLFYLLSDFLFFLGYNIVGYRKKVIKQNLQNAFPKKSESEIDILAKKYFAFMVDLFLETFKLLVMEPSEVEKRVIFTNTEILKPFAEKNQSIIFVLGHYGNWEWCGQSFHLKKMFQQDVLYHPLKSKFFDWITHKLRARFGVGLIPMQVSIKEMIRRNNMLTATAFLADQTPSNKDASHWMPFLNQDTAVFLGTEKIAKKLKRPVVFVHMKRLKRGFYETSFTLIAAEPQHTNDLYVTEKHTQMLEADIQACPELWLWSHRRWKHKR